MTNLTETPLVDMNGNPITMNCSVLVHQDCGTIEATVVGIFPENLTINQPGFWVDIDSGDGPHGMMSYILEVKI